MTPLQKKYRIKNAWKKAKLVYLFVKMRKRAIKRQEQKQQEAIQDYTDLDLEEISGQTEEWKWYIIRVQNTFP
jgi:hypothetical protein